MDREAETVEVTLSKAGAPNAGPRGEMAAPTPGAGVADSAAGPGTPDAGAASGVAASVSEAGAAATPAGLASNPSATALALPPEWGAEAAWFPPTEPAGPRPTGAVPAVEERVCPKCGAMVRMDLFCACEVYRFSKPPVVPSPTAIPEEPMWPAESKATGSATRITSEASRGVRSGTFAVDELDGLPRSHCEACRGVSAPDAEAEATDAWLTADAGASLADFPESHWRSQLGAEWWDTVHQRWMPAAEWPPKGDDLLIEFAAAREQMEAAIPLLDAALAKAHRRRRLELALAFGIGFDVCGFLALAMAAWLR